MGAARTDMTGFMQHALDLARRAEGFTAPNPMVGCVLVKSGAIIAEGWHHSAGAPHAEVNALQAAGAKAKGATLLVTLEPCNHHGRTPPCTKAILDSGVKEVVYALSDPSPAAAGGAHTLEQAGVKVLRGVCEDAARDLNRFWLKSVRTGAPYVVAKFAASLDGKIATRTGHSQWITGPQARAHAHLLRQQCDAIIVGAETVIADDPALTTRLEDRPVSHPLRVVLDSRARTSPGAKVFDRSAPGALLAVTADAPQERVQRHRDMGVDIIVLDTDEHGKPDVRDLSPALHKRGVNGVMIEGGGAVLGSFFDAGLVDEVWAYQAPVIIGGAGKNPVAGLGADRLSDALRLNQTMIERLGDDILIRGRVNAKETS